MANRFFNTWRFRLPGRLRSGDGGRIATTLSALLDMYAERVRQGLEARLPIRSAAAKRSSALELIGLDRAIIRGRTETLEHYAQRLVSWRYPRGHRVRGNALALLEQIWEYIGIAGATAISVDISGNVNEFDGEDTTTTHGVTLSMSAPGSSWSRFWLEFQGDLLIPDGVTSLVTKSLGDAGLWGGALGTDGYTIGLEDFTPDDIKALRRLVVGPGTVWRPAGTQLEWLVFTRGGDLVEASTDTTWARWATIDGSGNATAARSAYGRYVALRDALKIYSGDPEEFPQTATNVAGTGTYSGDDTSFPTSATAPDGSTYTGNSANFPTSSYLPDDGDQPWP